MTATNVLGVADAVTSWTREAGRRSRRRTQVEERHFAEFTIDGVPLRQLAEGQWDVPVHLTEMTRLCDTPPWPDEAVAGLRLLLADHTWEASRAATAIELPGDFDDGRVALLVCCVCADLGCRALSAEVVRGEGWVEWRRLGWQVNWQPSAQGDAFDPPVTFRFAADAYDGLLRPLRDRYARLAAEREEPRQRTVKSLLSRSTS